MIEKVRAGTSPLSPPRPQLQPNAESQDGSRSVTARRYPVGAEVLPGGGTHFRVWAPGRRKVEVVLEGPAVRSFELTAEDGGYFAGFVEADDGTRYRCGDRVKLVRTPSTLAQEHLVHDALGPYEVVGCSRMRAAQADVLHVDLIEVARR